MSLRRRTLLAAVPAAALAGCAAPVPRADLPAGAPADAAWLDRLTWGANAPSLRALQALGRARWLDVQLQPVATDRLPALAQAQLDAMAIEREPLPALVRRMDAQRRAADALADPAAKTAAQQAYQQEMNTLAREAATRQLLQALYGPQQLRERLSWFWLNHFSLYQSKADIRAMLGHWQQPLRTQALGRFRDLLGAAVYHPAMLRYLDNANNAVNRLNENFARELMELHTLGVDGGYTQADVQELARVLTGLGVSLADDTAPPPALRPAWQPLYVRRGLVEFHPARHDFGPKRLLGEPVAGTGLAEIDAVLDRLARHPATARHVCRRLAQFLGPDDPPPALVERLARRFLASDGRIDAVLRELLATPEFEASLALRFKDGQHWVLASLRLAWDERVLADPAPVLGWMQRLGQRPFDRSTPDGWPLEDAAWRTPAQLANRFDIAQAIAGGSPALFRREGAPAPVAPVPPLDNDFFRQALAPRLAPATREALAQAGAPAQWNALLLSAPELMRR